MCGLHQAVLPLCSELLSPRAVRGGSVAVMGPSPRPLNRKAQQPGFCLILA